MLGGEVGGESCATWLFRAGAGLVCSGFPHGGPGSHSHAAGAALARKHQARDGQLLGKPTRSVESCSALAEASRAPPAHTNPPLLLELELWPCRVCLSAVSALLLARAEAYL